MGIASAVSKSEPIPSSLPSELTDALAEARKSWDSTRGTERIWNGFGSRSADLLQTQLGDLSRFKALSAEVKEDGFTHVVLLSTDGSALATDAIHQAFRKQTGCLDWVVLDTADPRELSAVEGRVNPARTLFCTLHSQGSEVLTDRLAGHFFEIVRDAVGDEAKLHFIAISGSNTSPLPGGVRYRHVYAAEAVRSFPPDAFSDFGLTPLAAAGYSIERFLSGAAAMAQFCRNRDSGSNPGVALGLLLATAVSQSRDKLTFVCSPSVRALATWMAQSLGAAGLAFVPVVAEPPVAADMYGPDRVFVYLRTSHESDRDLEEHVSDLESAGHPVVRQLIEDAGELGQTMFQWQMAAAVAAAATDGAMPRAMRERERFDVRECALVSQGGLALFADVSYAPEVQRNGDSAGAVLRRHLDRINPGEFFGLAAFIPDTEEHRRIMRDIRKAMVECRQTATVLGFGPSFLTAAGAALLHTPASGTLLSVTSEYGGDDPALAEAAATQARAALLALKQSGRPILRVHLGPDITNALKQLRDLICAAVEH